MSWDDYDVFCHVIEHRGFSAAARALERPKSSVSAAVGRLEEALGTRLLERTTRHVHLTESGDALYQRIKAFFIELRDARTDALAQDNVVAGTLSIASTYEFGALYLGPVACKLMKEFPQLKVRIDVEQVPDLVEDVWLFRGHRSVFQGLAQRTEPRGRRVWSCWEGPVREVMPLRRYLPGAGNVFAFMGWREASRPCAGGSG